MDPHRRSVPRWRLEAGVPRREERIDIGLVMQLFGLVAREGVGARERSAPLVGSRPGRAGCVESLEREHERGEVDRQPAQVDRVVGAGVRAVEPGRDVPAEGVALGGLTHCERHRDFDREVGCERGKPPAFLLALLRCPPDLREAYRQVVAESEDRVIGAPCLDARERKVRELRELRREETKYERVVDVDLVAVHPRDGHR